MHFDDSSFSSTKLHHHVGRYVVQHIPSYPPEKKDRQLISSRRHCIAAAVRRYFGIGILARLIEVARGFLGWCKFNYRIPSCSDAGLPRLQTSGSSSRIVHPATSPRRPARPANVSAPSPKTRTPISMKTEYNSFNHPAAVLAICFGTSPMVGFSGGLDKRVRQWDFASGQCRVLGKHDGAISSLVWCTEFSECPPNAQSKWF